MASIAFDTHAFVKELTQVGMPEEQAEVLARSQVILIDEKLTTKRDLKELETLLTRDLKELETRLTHDLKELETRMTHDLKELETRMTLRLGSMMVVAVGMVAALVKLL